MRRLVISIISMYSDTPFAVLWCASPSHRYFCTDANLVGECREGGEWGGQQSTCGDLLKQYSITTTTRLPD